MSYRIDPTRRLDREIRRIGHEQLARAIESLQGEGGTDAGVHDARKRFKKVRGLYRLVRSAAPDFYRGENGRLRDAARSLSGFRDATAMVEAVDDLRGHLGLDGDGESLRLLGEKLAERRQNRTEQARSEMSERLASVIEACEAARAALDDLSIEAGTAGHAARIVGRGWQRVLSRGKKAMEACREEAAPEAFHDLRKRAKYHGMHARLLRDAWPGQMRIRYDAAKRFGDGLGHEHDLTVLIDLIGKEPVLVEGADRDLIMRLIADRQAELRAGALRAAATFFSGKPRRERKRMSLLWKRAAG